MGIMVQALPEPSMSQQLPTPAVVVRLGSDGTPYYEAKWREPVPHSRRAKQVKRRLGAAWLDPTEDGGWRKRRGRTPDGWLDERTAHVQAATCVRDYHEEQAALLCAPTRAETITVRELAHETLDWLRDEKGCAPSTLEDYGYMLREPGTPHKRGKGTSPGRIMKAFGDRPAIDVQPREIRDWLKELAAEGLQPRNVNKHRDLLHSIFAYGQRRDTYHLPDNPVAATDKRREPARKRVNYYEVDELEAVAKAAEQGAHRKPRGRKHPRHRGPHKPALLSRRQMQRQCDEERLRAEEDRRDAELLRVKFYGGLRLGEIRALEVQNVLFAPDMSGAMLDIQNAFSAGEKKPPKSWQPRKIAVPRPAAEALARVLARQHFTGPDDLVFCNRRGESLSDSAIRRRYKAACAKVGLRPLPLHALRHAAGSILSQKVDQVFAGETLGHQRLSTTDRYTHGKIDWRSIALVNQAFGVTRKRRKRGTSVVTSVPSRIVRLSQDPAPRVRVDLAPSSRTPALVREGAATLTVLATGPR